MKQSIKNKSLFFGGGKLFALSFLFLFLINSVSAAQVVVNPDSSLSLSLNVVDFGDFKQNTQHTLNLYVINSSSGATLSNSTINCVFHLYDNNGKHISESTKVSFSKSGGEWEQIIPETNLTRVGIYNYRFGCNNTITGQAGFVSGDFLVTPSGDGTDNLGFYVIFFLFAFGLVIFGIKYQDTPITTLGGLTLIILGLYCLVNGINIYRNFGTEAISWITIGLGAILAIVPNLEEIERMLPWTLTGN